MASILKGRGDGSERPQNEGDLSPDHGPDRRDIALIETLDAKQNAPSTQENVGKLEKQLDGVQAQVMRKIETQRFRSMESLRQNWSKEELEWLRLNQGP